MFKRIDHVEITTGKLEESIAFYRDVLGFRVRERIKLDLAPVYEIVYMMLGDTTLELIGAKDPPVAALQPWQIGYRMMAIEVEDMDKALAYLKTKGIEPSKGPVTTGKTKRAEIKDINGVSMELRQW